MSRPVFFKKFSRLLDKFSRINPQWNMTYYQYSGFVVDDSGIKTATYNNFSVKGRVQPVSKELVYKNKLELGTVYKEFWLEGLDISIPDRVASDDGDYISYNNEFYRVMTVNIFDVSWINFTAQKTDGLGG